MIVLILTSGPNYAQSHTHSFVNFTSEKLCKDAATEFENGLGSPFDGMKVEVRAVCSQRKNKGGKDE